MAYVLAIHGCPRMQEVILTGTTYQQTPNSDNIYIWLFVHAILIQTQKLLENRCQVASPKSVWHAETNTSIIQSDRSDLKCTWMLNAIGFTEKIFSFTTNGFRLIKLAPVPEVFYSCYVFSLQIHSNTLYKYIAFVLVLLHI